MTQDRSNQILFEGIMIDVKFKPIRTLRLIIHRDGTPSLSIPTGMHESVVLRFLEQHKEWILSKQKEAQKRHQEETEKYTPNYDEGELLIFLGKPYPLRFHIVNEPTQVVFESDAIRVKSRIHLSAIKTRLLIEAWYSQQIRKIIINLVNIWLIRMEEKPITEIRFRKMSSRWGSCCPERRILCFNTRLIFKPIECVEEVVVHELCHLKEASHNKRFHALMTQYLPDYKIRNKILNS